MKNCIDKKKRIFGLIAAIVIPLFAGGFSAFLTAADMDLYETMSRPPVSPPGWLFPIVWTVLYILMGLASYIVFASDAEPEQRRKALTFYAAQLVMNMFWSVLFFTYERYLIAFIWLLIMWVLILISTVRFYKIHPVAGYMMGALAVWTMFAGYLNLACFVISIR